jgi:hypothetical protein
VYPLEHLRPLSEHHKTNGNKKHNKRKKNKKPRNILVASLANPVKNEGPECNVENLG